MARTTSSTTARANVQKTTQEKKAPVVNDVKTEATETVEPEREVKQTYKVKQQLDKDMYVPVRNGFNGKLIYKSRKTGETYVWQSFGDSQEDARSICEFCRGVICMSGWDRYERYRDALGRSKREMWVQHTRENYARKMLESPSCRDVQINDIEQTVCIVHTAEMDQKKIFSLPGEHLEHGGLVTFSNNKWLITELDADNQIYDKGIMQQCNHILRWISKKDGALKEKWCYVADGTKYLIGEKARELLTIGDARIAVTVGKDEDTIELERGLRFLIDDTDSDAVLAYQITKPNKMFNVFNSIVRPSCMAEADERRVHQCRAVSACERLRMDLQDIIDTVPIEKNWMTQIQPMIDKEIALIQAWKKSDNGMRKVLRQKENEGIIAALKDAISTAEDNKVLRAIIMALGIQFAEELPSASLWLSAV